MYAVLTVDVVVGLGLVAALPVAVVLVVGVAAAVVAAAVVFVVAAVAVPGAAVLVAVVVAMSAVAAVVVGEDREAVVGACLDVGDIPAYSGDVLSHRDDLGGNHFEGTFDYTKIQI